MCFMDLAKMIIEVCVCVVRLVSSQPHSPCSPDRAGALVAQNTHNTKVPGLHLSKVKLKGSAMSIFV